jgi:uncharacterized surface protein with fasciclin (FAS1) repeats
MKHIYRYTHFLYSLLALTLMLGACKSDKGEVLLQPRGERDIVEVMQRETNGDFSMFLEALELTGVGNELRVEANKNPEKRYIVFAPTNKAFGALLLQLGTASVSQTDITVLRETVKSHIHQLSVTDNNIQLEDLTSGDYKTLQAGRDIYVNFDCDGNPYLNGKTIVAFERAAKNGYVYAIEDVILQPTKTLAEILNSDPELAILNQLIAKAGLTGALADPTKTYTIFAPPNAVLLNASNPSVGYPFNLNPANFNTTEEIAVLDSILRYHVLAGRVYSLSVCTEKPYTSLLGQDLQLDVAGNIGGGFNDFTSIVSRNAHYAKNGVIHRVDFPLLPAKINIRQRIAQLPENPGDLTNSFSIAKQALALTGLDVSLEKVDRVTVLLPNDAAFSTFLTANNFASIYDVPVDKLTTLLEYHVITRRAFYNDFSASSTSVIRMRTLQGEEIPTPARGTANYVTTPSFYADPSGRIDMKLSNGNVHVVRKVQIPKALNFK